MHALCSSQPSDGGSAERGHAHTAEATRAASFASSAPAAIRCLWGLRLRFQKWHERTRRLYGSFDGSFGVGPILSRRIGRTPDEAGGLRRPETQRRHGELNSHCSVVESCSGRIRCRSFDLLKRGKGFRPGGANLYDSSSSLCTSDLQRLDLARIAEIFQPDSLWPYEATTLAPVTYANGVSGEIPDQTPVPTLHPRTIGLSARATY
jgi:hypothetical protein